MLREFMANSLFGAALDDEAVRTGLAAFLSGIYGWNTDEGYCFMTLDSSLTLMPRCLMALLETDTDESRRGLRVWLPPAAELMRIAEFEVGWMALSSCHPSLLCAQLHGERLGDWTATEQVATGVLKVELFNPMLRTQASRLLGRAHMELGRRSDACDAAGCAAAEAAKAKYVWLEYICWRDMLRWCEEGEAALARSRLQEVEGRMLASREELVSLLGE